MRPAPLSCSDYCKLLQAGETATDHLNRLPEQVTQPSSSLPADWAVLLIRAPTNKIALSPEWTQDVLTQDKETHSHRTLWNVGFLGQGAAGPYLFASRQ